MTTYVGNNGFAMRQALELQESRKQIEILRQEVVNYHAVTAALKEDKRRKDEKIMKLEAELMELREQRSAEAAAPASLFKLETRSATSATDHVQEDDAHIKELQLKLKVMTEKTVGQAATIEGLQNFIRQNTQFRRQDRSELQNWQTEIGKMIERLDAQVANDEFNQDNEQDIEALNDALDREIEALNDSVHPCDLTLLLSEIELLNIEEERSPSPPPCVAAAWGKITVEDMAVIDEIYGDVMLNDKK